MTLRPISECMLPHGRLHAEAVAIEKAAHAKLAEAVDLYRQFVQKELEALEATPMTDRVLREYFAESAREVSELARRLERGG